MIRYLAVLGIFLYASLYFLGKDTGQWINPPGPVAKRAAVVAQVRPVFIPAQPVMQVPVQPVADQQVAPAVPVELISQTVDPVEQPVVQPVPSTGRLMHAPAGANVRSGPGSNFAIIATITAGDAVLVVDETSSANWVQVAGDGGSGWVSRRLLRE